MFQKVGKKVMAIAKTMFWIECCIFGVIGIYLGALTSSFFVMLLSVAIGVVISYLSVLVFYILGQLSDNSEQMVENSYQQLRLLREIRDLYSGSAKPECAPEETERKEENPTEAIAGEAQWAEPETETPIVETEKAPEETAPTVVEEPRMETASYAIEEAVIEEVSVVEEITTGEEAGAAKEPRVIEAEETAQAETKQEPPVTAESKIGSEPDGHCPNCGFERAFGRFCPRCGSKLRA